MVGGADVRHVEACSQPQLLCVTFMRGTPHASSTQQAHAAPASPHVEEEQVCSACQHGRGVGHRDARAGCEGFGTQSRSVCGQTCPAIMRRRHGCAWCCELHSDGGAVTRLTECDVGMLRTSGAFGVVARQELSPPAFPPVRRARWSSGPAVERAPSIRRGAARPACLPGRG